MGFIEILMMIGAVLLTALRSLALSPLGARLPSADAWQFDVGARYGWLFIGIVFFLFLVIRVGLDNSMLPMAAIWVIGLAAIWVLPPVLVKLF